MATTFFMKIKISNDEVLSVATGNLWVDVPETEVIRSASFAESPPADVVVHKGRPLVGGTFTSEGVYTHPLDLWIKAIWSGDGTLVPSIYEMTSNGANSATLTLQKWDVNNDVAITTGGETYWIGVSGSSVKPNKGKIVLSASGWEVVNFTPEVDEKGLANIIIMPEVESDPKSLGVVKLGLS